MIGKIQPLCVQSRQNITLKDVGKLAENTIPNWGMDSDTMKEIYNGDKGIKYLHKSTALIRDLAEDVANNHFSQARDARLMKTLAQKALDMEKQDLNRSQQMGLYIATLTAIGACGSGVNSQTLARAYCDSSRKVGDVRSYGNPDKINYKETEQKANEIMFANAQLIAEHTEDKTAQAILKAGKPQMTTFVALGKVSGYFDDAAPLTRKMDAVLLGDIAGTWSVNGLNWSIDRGYIGTRCEEMEQTFNLIDNLVPQALEAYPPDEKSILAIQKIGVNAISSARNQSPAEKLGIYQGALAVIAAVQDDLTPGTIVAALDNLDDAQHAIVPGGKESGVKNRAMKESGVDSISILRRAMKNH